MFSFASDLTIPFWTHDPFTIFLLSSLAYLGILLFLWGQTWISFRFSGSRLQSYWPILINSELLIFFCFCLFGIGSQQLFHANYSILFLFSCLFFYFFAWGWSHYWMNRLKFCYTRKKCSDLAWTHVLFFVPFCFPFLMIGLLLDLIHAYPVVGMNQEWLTLGLLLGILVCSLILFPPLMVLFWRCHPLNDPCLQKRLEEMCQIMHFKYAKFKVWTTMKQSVTAGIIGIVPAFRYILFTPALLNHFSIEEIEAILIHEIGHSRYKHLLIYPFIMLGMILLTSFTLLGMDKILQSKSDNWMNNDFSFLSLMFFLNTLVIGLYFRFIFGFFSRLFERQADLFIFESPLSPHYMVQSLDHLGVVTGNTHRQPSWHHFSLQQRIDFLRQAIENPSLVQKHHRQVKQWIFIYFFVLISGFFFLFY